MKLFSCSLMSENIGKAANRANTTVTSGTSDSRETYRWRQHRQAIVIDTLVQQPSGDAGFNRRGQLLAAENDMVTP